MGKLRLVAVVLFFSPQGATFGQDAAPSPEPVAVIEDFARGIDRWELIDPDSWNHDAEGGFLRLGVKEFSYTPPHHSPKHIAILKETVLGDFGLSVRVRSTNPDYGHRDVCLFLGWQDPAHFYYVHLGRTTDEHCNQIFIVDGADRTAITERGNDGTPWDDDWHTVRVVRRVETGEIAIYWDGSAEPVLTATDKRLVWGRNGVGSFDDTGDFDDLRIVGTPAGP